MTELVEHLMVRQVVEVVQELLEQREFLAVQVLVE
tara:strand:- start:233 stop:337 length:105 start_codon:yes stop_codon:yes gene_type:complete